MTVKLIQYFDVVSGKENEFRRFALESYLPVLRNIGLVRPIGAWYVACGEGPFHIFESVAESVGSIHGMLEQDDYVKLNRLLNFLVTNYKSKMLAPGGLVQAHPPEGRHYRFNHHFEVRVEAREKFDRFFSETYLPVMNTAGIDVIGAWEEVVGPGPGFVTEGASDSIARIMRTIAGPAYRGMIRKMFTFVTGFGSKILSPALREG